MKLIDAIKKKGKPYWIPDCSRNDLPQLFKQLGFTTGVEIGVHTGLNIISYCKAGFTMFGIDPYVDYEIHQLSPTRPPDVQHMAGVYKSAKRRLKIYPNCTLIKKSSMDALVDFPDASLDFVYIDGSHKYGHVAMDLMEWAQKIKKGGVIAGHDYYRKGECRANRGVQPAVDGFIRAFGISHFWVLGSKHPKKDERHDSSLSYIMFKYW